MPPETKPTTAPIAIRKTTPTSPFAGLTCAFNGHLLRAVLRGRTPIGLECTRCLTTWDVQPHLITETEGESE